VEKVVVKLKSKSKQSSLLRYFPLDRYPRLNRAFDWFGLVAIGIWAVAGFCALTLGPLYFMKTFPDAPLSQLYFSLFLKLPKPLGAVIYVCFQLSITLVLAELGGRIVQFRLWGHERFNESVQTNDTNKPDVK
jgi:hypothetical protein